MPSSPCCRPRNFIKGLNSSASQAFVQMQTLAVGLGAKGCGDQGGAWQVRVGHWDGRHLDRQRASAVSPGEGSSGGIVPLAGCQSLCHRTDAWAELGKPLGARERLGQPLRARERLGLCPSEPEKGWGSQDSSGQAPNSHWCQHPVPLILPSHLPRELSNA